MRLERADTIVLIDASRPRMLWGALRRYFKHRGKTRPSMGGNCVERMDLNFLRWIWRYPSDERPVLLQQVSAYGGHSTLVTLRTRREIDKWLAEIACNASTGGVRGGVLSRSS